MKEVRCRDVGADCDYVVRGKTEEELFQNATEHVKTAHGMNEITPETKTKMRQVMREVQPT